MSIAPLVVLSALAVAPQAGPDPTALVAKLGSADPSERASATESLKALGREALPALEKAMKAVDSGLRERSSILWEAIERDLMSLASTVRLDGLDRPREAILEDLEKQTGLALHLDQSAREGRIAIPEPATVPFWDALERLGLRGVYHHNLGEGKSTRLELRNDPTYQIVSNAGAFRVSLTGLHLHRDNQLIPAPWVRIDGNGQRINVWSDDPKVEPVTFYGGLEVMVEPRMWFTQEAPARIIEAVDDLGQSLVPEDAGPNKRPGDNAHFAFYAGSGGTRDSTRFRLRPVEKLGRSARLRGAVPVMLHIRRPEPSLVIPLAAATGKTFKCDDAEFIIRTVNDTPKATNVSLTAQLNLDRADLADKADNVLVTSRLLVMSQHQFQLVDADGKVMADSISSGSTDGRNSSYQATMSTWQNGRATHFRYYGVLRVRSEAAFDFRDVPLP
jgi:hypothetical protein